MKKLILISALFLCSFSASFAQSTIKTVATGNVLSEVTTPATLESLTTTSEKTAYTFKTASGEELPVYKSVNGKLFVCRLSKKTGNYYKQYITIDPVN